MLCTRCNQETPRLYRLTVRMDKLIADVFKAEACIFCMAEVTMLTANALKSNTLSKN